MAIINSSAVQERMLELGVGVIELSELAKIPAKTISALHRKDKRVFIPTLARLAKALQVEPRSLVKAAQ